MQRAIFLHSGGPHQTLDVTLVIRQPLKETLTPRNSVSPGLLYSWLQHHRGHLSVVVDYAPTGDTSAVEKDAFYEQLVAKIQTPQHDILLDFKL